MANANWNETHRGIWGRMREGQKQAGVETTQEAVGKSAGVKQPSAQRWTSGVALPTLRQAITFSVATGAAVQWILTGALPKYSTEERRTEESALAEILDGLDPHTRKEVIQFAEFCKDRKVQK